MEKDVIISIKGVQRYENADPDTMELVTAGRLEREGNSYTLSYQESELTGLEGTLTTFQIEPERVTLMRVGELNSQMVFEEGRRHMSMYNTPYGAMTIGVNTRHLLAELSDRGGEIEIDYAIEIDHGIAGRNVFQINVKESDGAAGLRFEVVNFDSKRFAEGKTLPETGLCPVEDCNNRVPAAACRRGQLTTPWQGGIRSKSM